MRRFAIKCFEESTVHGLPYIVKKELSWTEKAFWIGIIILSALGAFSICWDQWIRYKTSPIVYSVDRNYQNVKVPKIGATMCSNFVDLHHNREIVQKIWNVDVNETKFQYYMDFLLVLSKLKYNTFELLKPYENDITLEKLDFLNLTFELRSTLNFHEEFVEDGQNYDHTNFIPVVTEAGICFSSTTLNKYLNPTGKIAPIPIVKHDLCGALDDCTMKITPPYTDGSEVTVHLHPIQEIFIIDEHSIITNEISGNITLLLDIQADINIADGEVRNIPISSRKCIFKNENYLEYFDDYTPHLCKIECRINKALQLCGCKPYFYVPGMVPVCDIKGMLCLARKSNSRWYDAKCECYELCVNFAYIETRKTNHSEDQSFRRNMLISMQIPNIIVKKRVVFSMDQLVVSFGGAASFFLGCNFLSIIEIIFFLFEYCVEKCKIILNYIREKF